MNKKIFTNDKHEIEISKPDKVLFPEDDITKANLADYYKQIFEFAKTHIENRPVMLQIFPDGITEKGFYKKEAGKHFPDHIDRVRVKLKKEDKDEQELIQCNEPATLIYLADQAAVSQHIWLSTAQKLNHPNKMVFDLDPPEGEDFNTVRKAAKKLTEFFSKNDIRPFAMTTGSKGLHIIIPLKQNEEFEKVRETAKQIAKQLTERHDDVFTTETRKNKREGKIFLDYLRNAYGQTTIAPYSPRPLKGAPVACPLALDEMDNPDLTSQSYTVKNIFYRLGQKDDPWKNIQKHAIGISKIKKALN
jgi:bifunctional non-homologous end joining protein LigD